MAANRLLPYAQLLRLPNVFTAMADILAGYLFTHRSLQPAQPFAALLIASSCIYLAGMVLNDVVDAERDRRERPERPIPSGRITRRRATWIGLGLLLAGLAAAFAAGQTAARLAAGLAACVLLYDGLLKTTPLGPPLMGGCRGLNFLLGASTTAAPWATPNLYVAATVWLYITNVTLLARHEAGRPSRISMEVASTGLNVAIVMAAGLFLVYPVAGWPYLAPLIVLAGVLNVGLRRVGERQEPVCVQAAVKTCLVSLILLDAAFVCAACGVLWMCVVLALLVPTLALGRYVYST